MAWLPSYQELREHPKTRKAVVLLGVPRAQVIGHLHCLWWWALSYADDGDLSRYDATDIALAAEWDGDPEKFLHALASCGAGGRPGFLDETSGGWALHDWSEYAGKYVEKRRKDALRKRPSDGTPTEDRATSSGTPSEGAGREEREERGEETRSAGTSKRKTSQPDGWAPNDTHVRIAAEERVDLEREAQKFSDHHASKGTKFVDWDRAFCTWLRNAPGFGGARLRAVGDEQVRYT